MAWDREWELEKEGLLVQHLEFKAFDEVERFGAEGENEGEAVGVLGNSLRFRLVEQDVLHRDQLALGRGFYQIKILQTF